MRRDDAGRDLIEVINRLADDKRCGAISVSVVRSAAIVVNPTPVYGRFARNGMAADAVRLRKQVAQVPATASALGALQAFRRSYYRVHE